MTRDNLSESPTTTTPDGHEAKAGHVGLHGGTIDGAVRQILANLNANLNSRYMLAVVQAIDGPEGTFEVITTVTTYRFPKGEPLQIAQSTIQDHIQRL